MILGWLSMAWAACGDGFESPPDVQTVAWISPVRKRVVGRSSLRVIPVAALREAASQGNFTTGRLLQLLGERKKARPPRRAWKVTIFEASSGGLCRPVVGDPAAFVGGVPACPASWSRSNRKDTGCGTTRDRGSSSDGLEMYRARWRDLAPQGFCVLPADRFVAEL